MEEIHQIKGNKAVSKLGVGLLILSIIVLFSTLGVAYMRANKTVEIQLPALFYINCLILLLGSVSLHLGWKAKQSSQQKNLLRIALGLGLVFLVSQGFAWAQLYEQGIDIATSGQQASYLYLLTALHAAHIIGGLTFLAYVLFAYDKKGKSYFEGALFFWHFLGLLWVYLICLLLI